MKKQWKWTLGVIGFCILANIAWIAISLEIRFHAEDSGAKVASQFLGALQNHNYASARALMAQSEQAAVSVTALQKAQENIESKKGQWLTPAMELEHHPNETLDHITYFYEVGVKQDGGMPLMVRVVRTTSGWHVLEYQYNESAA